MINRIELIKGDITKLEVDAIVNAANRSLLGGGGVDGAIHRAAGQGLLDECRTLDGCDTGEAKITRGYNLPSMYVIHTAGPVWQEDYNEPELLASCYRNSLALAVKNRCKSITFPNISTGVYAFPKHRAAKIATTEVKAFLEKDDFKERVVIFCFDEENYRIYRELLR